MPEILSPAKLALLQLVPQKIVAATVEGSTGPPWLSMFGELELPPVWAACSLATCRPNMGGSAWSLSSCSFDCVHAGRETANNVIRNSEIFILVRSTRSVVRSE